MSDRAAFIWDLPIRITHWLFAACVGVSWWTAETRHMDWHRYSGYTLLGLLVFRVYWGFAGSPTARFSGFVRGPAAVLNHLRQALRTSGTQARMPGHTAAGGWSVMAMLSIMLLQAGLGLFVTDVDGLESGPLSYLVSFDTGRALAAVHEIVFNVLLALIALHIVAILFYLLRHRDNLIVAMLRGSGPARETTPLTGGAPAWRIWPGVALAGLVVWLVTR